MTVQFFVISGHSRNLCCANLLPWAVLTGSWHFPTPDKFNRTSWSCCLVLVQGQRLNGTCLLGLFLCLPPLGQVCVLLPWATCVLNLHAPPSGPTNVFLLWARPASLMVCMSQPISTDCPHAASAYSVFLGTERWLCILLNIHMRYI